MSAIHSKSALLHGQVRQALLSGRYTPGQRIDPGRLAAEFHTSPTPVRVALYRLVGEGMISDHARSGLHVPLPTEAALRDLYDWMQRLLLMACDIGPRRAATSEDEARALASSNPDTVKQTWLLFDSIAHATSHRYLHRAVKQANDQLAPIRRAKQSIVEHNTEELSELISLWQTHDIPSLASALRRYHERRKQLAPRIMAILNHDNNYP